MKMIPLKIEYFFELKHHTMRASVEHQKDERRVCYYFDEKLVSTKQIPEDDFLTDDDCICEILENYCKTHTGVFADLFNNHADAVHLVKKNFELQIENHSFVIDATVISEKDAYSIFLSGNNGQDTIACRLQSSSFSDALEKTRIFLNTMDGISQDLSRHISEFSNDKVMERIQWQ